MADNSGLIVDALWKTNPKLASSIDANNSWKASLLQRGARVALYRNYERGDHRANMTVEMRKMLRLGNDNSGLNELNVNYCKIVVDKMAGRVHISNIVVNDEAKDWLGEMLLYNDFDASQSMWWRAAIRDGDAYAMIDPQTLRWSSEPAYDGFSGVVTIVDTLTRKPVWACKLWSEADSADASQSGRAAIRLVVYQPDMISYWVGVENSAEVEPINDETGFNFTEWGIGKIPIVSLINQQDNYTSYGESELRVVIPLQDALNRTQHSKLMTAEFSAFMLLWSIGFQISVDAITPGSVVNMCLTDDSGNIITRLTPEQVSFLSAAKVGQFQASDLGQYISMIDAESRNISQVSQTPIYGITTQGNLSGEALKQLEIGLIGKVERFQHQNTDAILELIQLTAEIQNNFDTDIGGNAPEITELSVVWKSPEILDVNQRIQALVNLRANSPGLFTDAWYIGRIGSLLGMSQQEIESAIEDAQTNQVNILETLVGAGGGIPVG